MAKASDFSKRIKAKHLGGLPRELTIGQIGAEPMQKRNKSNVQILAGSGMQTPDQIKVENIVYLWFRELGATRNMRLNETNLDVLISARGEEFKEWVDCKVTLTPESIFAFGKQQETIVLSNVKAPLSAKQAKPTQTVNKQTGEITETKDQATPFWARAKDLGKMKEASEILARHTDKSGTVVEIDWANAMAELNTLEVVPA